MKNEKISKEKLKEQIREKLVEKTLSAPFPPCTDILLSQVATEASGINKEVEKAKEEGKKKEEETKDDIVKFYEEYFSRLIEISRIIEILTPPLTSEDEEYIKNMRERILNVKDNIKKEYNELSLQWYQIPTIFPWCLPPSLTILNGRRGTKPTDWEEKPWNITTHLKRLFIGDLVWLFYFERMGIFKILGVILDDFATKGKYPISNEANKGKIAGILETMVRLTKMGLSSTVRDRDSSYRRCLGWTSDVGRKLGLDTVANTAFNSLFHKFIQVTLEYYKDKRLAVAIKGAAAPAPPPSVATLITIGDTIDVLKKAFKPFDYGRNHLNTLSGIVWVIAAMDLIKRMKTTLGIPDSLKDPYEYIPAAYDILVMGRSITPSEINRYKIHLECARNARDVLLDLEVLDHESKDEKSGLETWLDIAEARIEGYRTAYRSLTGVDLATSGTPQIEQQV
ncbi:TPA: hypothetical protein DCX16_04620 [bacterium]|nr:hypothetical protein [bacterium]